MICMQVEKTKYVLWAADVERAVRFYSSVFGATLTKQTPVIVELEIAGATISIHSGGEGKPTWTGLSFQVADVVAGAAEVAGGGGLLRREPQPEDDEPPHLAMCADPEGNQFMLTRARS